MATSLPPDPKVGHGLIPPGIFSDIDAHFFLNNASILANGDLSDVKTVLEESTPPGYHDPNVYNSHAALVRSTSNPAPDSKSTIDILVQGVVWGGQNQAASERLAIVGLVENVQRKVCFMIGEAEMEKRQRKKRKSTE